jgi:hypothetical protein
MKEEEEDDDENDIRKFIKLMKQHEQTYSL